MTKREMKRRAKALAIGLACVPAAATFGTGYFMSNVNDYKIERLQEDYQENKDQATLKQIDKAKNYSMAGKIALAVGGVGVVAQTIALVAICEKYKRKKLFSDNPLQDEVEDDIDYNIYIYDNENQK